MQTETLNALGMKKKNAGTKIKLTNKQNDTKSNSVKYQKPKPYADP